MTTDPIAAARTMIEPLTGYTPRPWKAWQPRHDESVPVRIDELGITIAYVHQGAVTSAHNNARLIAAAPDLRYMVATLADALEAERAKVAAARLEGWRAGRDQAHVGLAAVQREVAHFSATHGNMESVEERAEGGQP